MVILKHNAVSVILLRLRKSSCLHICIDCNFYCACKNRHILGFFTLLVEMGIFKDASLLVLTPYSCINPHNYKN